MRFSVYAVGSNEILTEEIKNAMDEILCQSLSIIPCTIGNLHEHRDGKFYICNESLRKDIITIVPNAVVSVLNLMPISSFYLHVRQIPIGEKIYILNNRRPYCNTLIELCHETGLTEYEYIPIVTEEMTDAEVNETLAQAKYLIGVKNVLDAALSSGRYKLGTKTQVIGAQRVASVATINAIVSQLNQHLLIDCKEQLSMLEISLQKLRAFDALHDYYTGVTRSLQNIQSILDSLDDQTSLSKRELVMKVAINQLR